MEIRCSTAGALAVGLWWCVPGLLLSPFVFWQSPAAGFLFVLGWCGSAILTCRVRLGSLLGRLRAGELSVSRGVLFQTTRRMPTRFISGVTRVETPLLRRLHASLVVVHNPAGTLLLPGLDADDARRLESALTGGRL